MVNVAVFAYTPTLPPAAKRYVLIVSGLIIASGRSNTRQNARNIFPADINSVLREVDFALYKTMNGSAIAGKIFVKKPSIAETYPFVLLPYMVKRRATIRIQVGNASDFVNTKYAVENAVA